MNEMERERERERKRKSKKKTAKQTTKRSAGRLFEEEKGGRWGFAESRELVTQKRPRTRRKREERKRRGGAAKKKEEENGGRDGGHERSLGHPKASDLKLENCARKTLTLKGDTHTHTHKTNE